MGPKIHCLTNPVVMQDTANLLLAAGGSAIMAQEPEEVEEITSFCQATLLNTGVPDERKWEACILAGKRANILGHPVILDPVGLGASRFRRKWMKEILRQVKISVIRCNQEEACALLSIDADAGYQETTGGVESAVSLEKTELEELARHLAKNRRCSVLISGKEDIASDGVQIKWITGGDERVRKLTGGGCMLSALCALLCGAGYGPYEAVCEASRLWKESARRAGIQADGKREGIGSFHRYLFDAVEELCCERPGKEEEQGG